MSARLLPKVITPTFESYGHTANPGPLTLSQLDNRARSTMSFGRVSGVHETSRS